QMLKGEESRLESYPDMLDKVRQHQQLAQSNREALGACIQRLGGDTSTLKDLGAQLLGLGQAFSGVVFSDEVMKAILGWYSTQRLAIASYRILATAAQTCGDTQTQTVVEGILSKEQALNNWLEDYMPRLT